MLYFQSDYIKGAHPDILQALIDSNDEPLSGYGTDKYSLQAAEKIKHACQHENSEVYFLSGGTQTNKIVIASMLDTFEGVIAADSGHISIHEAGAIEASGRKVLALPNIEGKISAQAIQDFLTNFNADQNNAHMVKPGMVYLSHPTEHGTLYTYQELEEISQVCRQANIPLFLDGARLIYSLVPNQNELDLEKIAKLVDVFYIGGTKAGTLLGEALVFTNRTAPSHFVTRIKQFGALLAKNRVLGTQFDALFSNDLYLKIAAHTDRMSKSLIQILEDKGYEFYIKSPTNQQFVIVTQKQYEAIQAIVQTSFWETLPDGRVVIRFATSWSTSQEDIDQLRIHLPNCQH